MENYPLVSDGLDFYIESSILVGGILVLLIIAEVFTHIFISKGRIDISSVSFITALKGNHKYSLYFLFPITLLFEELLFRGIIFNFLLSYFTPFFTILISAGIFGIYHIHILILSKNNALGLIFIIFSFFLGLILGKIVFYFGILGCWVVHLLIVSYIYLRWNHFSMQLGKKNEK
nr:CPBP family intramembrane glutamic endopeptidase [Candidatus Prometheoarchaeum syntrophicum]